MLLSDVGDALVALPLPRLGERAHPERSVVDGARPVVAAAVADDRFLADCIRHEIDLVGTGAPRAGLVPFHVLGEIGARFAFGYWPPGAGPGPHEHTAWTITAVCRNQLEVLTYDRDESYRRGELVPRRRFTAPQAQVGFIAEPAIHAPFNPSGDWTLSLHISSPLDGEPVACPGFLPPEVLGPQPGTAGPWSDHPYAAVVGARQRDVCARLLAGVVAAMDRPDDDGLLARCLQQATTATARAVVDATGHPAPTAFSAPWRLRRVHDGLRLHPSRGRGTVRLDVETPAGRVTACEISDLAHPAIAYAVDHPEFDIDALPGGLTGDERAAVGEALEATGIFERTSP